MNKVVLMGRLTKDPEIRYTQAAEPLCIARYTLAVDRKIRKDSEHDTTDFIPIIAFGRAGEFAEKYLCKGMRVCVAGRIQTGSYEKDGRKVYTTDVVVDEQDFADGKQTESKPAVQTDPAWEHVDEQVELPFR